MTFFISSIGKPMISLLNFFHGYSKIGDECDLGSNTKSGKKII